jgi:signal transduction histidine kinase
LYACLCWGLTCQAQSGDGLPFKRCLVKTLNFEQGLLNNGTNCIVTDIKGFTWVSTETGLQRYNGYSFENIRPVIQRDTIAISSSVLLFSLSNGCLWISCRQGILAYSPFTNSFRHIVALKAPEEQNYSINPLKETHEGIWCMQQGKGIVLYDTSGKIVREFPDGHPSFIDSIFRSGTLLTSRAYTCNNQFIFVHNNGSRILKIDLRSHQIRAIDLSVKGPFTLSSNQHLLYALSAYGLYSMDLGTEHVQRAISLKTILGEQIYYHAIAAIGQNELVVSLNNHLFELDSAFQGLKEFTSLDRKSIVTTGGGKFIYQDRYKRLWLLTNDDIKEIRNVEVPFQHFLYPNERNNFVRCLYYDEKEHLLLAGCYNGGVQLYDTLGNPLWQKPITTESVKDVTGIEKLGDDDYLIITLGKGWWRLRLKEQTIDTLPLAPGLSLHPPVLDNQYANNLQRTSDSTLLVASYENVYRYVFRKGKLVAFQALLPTSTLPPGHIVCLFRASDGAVWVGETRGVINRVDKDGQLRQFQVPGNYTIRSMTEDAMHHIWVGSEKGAYQYSLSGKWLSTFTRETGLLNDCIYAELPLDHGAGIFTSSNFGLSYISSDGTIKNYTKEMGLQENEFNSCSCVKTASGKFFFGGVNGITAFYPEALSATNDTPVINITRLVVDDSVYSFPSGGWNGDSILLAYNKNHLQFDFAALGLLNVNEYNYRYRVKTFEASWQTTRNPAGIRYTLDPGTYALEIECSPLLSSRSIFHKQFLIVIDPPWWQTWWFRFAAFIILFSSMALIFRQYNRWKYLRKIRDLQLQNELQNDRERISRELHDNIGTQLSYISSNVDWLLEAPVSFSKEEEVRRLSVVNDTAKHLVSDLRETIWAMKKESIQLDELADKLKSFLQSQCLLRPSMEMNVEEDILHNLRLSPTAALNIFRICQEAIVNSIKHANGGTVSLRIRSGLQEGFSIVVEDDGNGFPPDSHYPGHYGLENMRHRATELGAVLSIDSIPGSGTRVCLFSPPFQHLG